MKRPYITPDTWEHRGHRVYRKDSYEIAWIAQQGPHREWAANGKAIAALPDCLTAMERILPDWESDVDDASIADGKVCCEVTYGDIRAIKAALIKAGYTED